MSGICTAVSVCAGGAHVTRTIVLDGVTVVIKDTDDASALTAEETETLVRLGIRRLRAAGVTPLNFLGRCTHGDEATNVKLYNLLGPGLAITKTNIGTSYVDILPGLNGERTLIDFTGCTEFRLMGTANFIGTGNFGIRVVKDSDNTVLFENAALSQTGERELDTGSFAALPAAFLNAGLMYVRVQAKSATAADDPVFRRVTLAVR